MGAGRPSKANCDIKELNQLEDEIDDHMADLETCCDDEDDTKELELGGDWDMLDDEECDYE